MWGGGNNNVIIRIPSQNEHNNILLNSDLNGNIDITTSKLNVWNCTKVGIPVYDAPGFDFSMLQNNSTYNFINLSKHWGGGDYVQSYYNMNKSNKSFIKTNYESDLTLPCFRPIIEYRE